MKLVTFNRQCREDRIGALTADETIVDLNLAYALYLRNAQREGAFYALADARVPPSMRGLFENGDRGLDARAALVSGGSGVVSEAAMPIEPPAG